MPKMEDVMVKEKEVKPLDMAHNDFMSTTSISDLIDHEIAVAGLPVASSSELKAISYCESGLRHFNDDGTVLHGKVHPPDTGAMQINQSAWYDTLEDMKLDVEKPIDNVKFGVYLYQMLGNTPWKPSENCWKLLTQK